MMNLKTNDLELKGRIHVDNIVEMTLEEVKREKYFSVDENSYSDITLLTETELIRAIEIRDILNIEFVINASEEELRRTVLEGFELVNKSTVYIKFETRILRSMIWEKTRKALEECSEEELRISIFGLIKNDTREFENLIKRYM